MTAESGTVPSPVAPSPRTKQLIIVAMVVLFVLLVAIAVVLARRNAKVREANQDKALVDFVYDRMLVGAVYQAGHDCPLPTRNLKGTLRFETKGRLIVFTNLTPTPLPPNWSASDIECVNRRIVGFTQGPPDLDIPAGREYEIDVDLFFPPRQTRD